MKLGMAVQVGFQTPAAPDLLEMVGRRLDGEGSVNFLEKLRGFVGAMPQNGPSRDPAELSRWFHDECDPGVLDMQNINRFSPEVAPAIRWQRLSVRRRSRNPRPSRQKPLPLQHSDGGSPSSEPTAASTG